MDKAAVLELDSLGMNAGDLDGDFLFMLPLISKASHLEAPVLQDPPNHGTRGRIGLALSSDGCCPLMAATSH